MNAPCETWTERLSLLAADCLSADEAALVRRHAAACEGCGERLRELESLSESLFAARRDASAPAARIVARLEKAIASERPQPALPESRPVASAAWIALATALVAAGIFLGLTWSMGKFPEGVPVVIDGTPKEKPVEEPVVASRERPTLLDFQRAARESDDRLESLLKDDSSHVSLGGPAPRSSSTVSILDAMP